MVRRFISLLVAIATALATFLLVTPAAGAQEAEDPSVKAVLFFSPTCGHCEYVIQNVLPPLFAENGGQWDVYYDTALEEVGPPFFLLDNGTLQFLLVDVSIEEGSLLFEAATDRYDIENNGVPRMVIADEVFIGSADIPEALPRLIADGLAGAGIDWPSFPGVEAAATATTAPLDTTTTTVPDDEVTTTTTTGEVVLPTGDDSVADRFGRDPVGNTLAVIVLVGMLASLVGVAALWRRGSSDGRPSVAVPILALIGIGVAAYLSYVETSDTEAVCGPVGDCNAVQQSEYAELFGLIPIGVLGLIGYVVVVGAWLVARTDQPPASDWARVGLFAGALGGVLLSIYLTFLEPFVIGATCAWCLTSAVIVTALMWLSAGPAAESWSKLRSGAGTSHAVSAGGRS
ncbi:MAG: vitamin K epoxide reductase family protein [Acidimicrobiia bacterium]|nr:vitamin K epoxide reductase family protein [Acidimicrobiia bacterium]